VLGGLPDVQARQVKSAIHIPKFLSILAHGDRNAVVLGLDQVPAQDWPPVTIVHVAFQVMVGCGMILLAVSLVALGLLTFRKKPEDSRRFLGALVVSGPLGLIALEAGWTVTEVGRQPWIVVGIMRVRDAVTPMPGLAISLAAVCAIYALLGTVVAILLWRYVLSVPEGS
jgi:cytochrome d ubiquinol oxidase subunit I